MDTFLDLLPKMLNLVWEVVWYHVGDPVWMQPCMAVHHEMGIMWRRLNSTQDLYLVNGLIYPQMTHPADEWFVIIIIPVGKKQKLDSHTCVRL